MANNDISLIYLVRTPKISQIVSLALECVTIIISYGQSRPQLRSELADEAVFVHYKLHVTQK